MTVTNKAISGSHGKAVQNSSGIQQYYCPFYTWKANNRWNIVSVLFDDRCADCIQGRY
ncbi:uncharacterized protein METZ01_LOCUS308614 [marine metagenome]|uniref:Uncharacterized protein n=1 Tax=marine metagenome TaxID=408172 RepID=A0A382N4R2_9ZZZZ